MTQKVFVDYIVSDKGLFFIPQREAVLSVALWQEIAKLPQTKDLPKPLKRLFDKNPSFLEQIKKASPLIATLPTYKVKDPWSTHEEDCYEGFTGNFSSNLSNEVHLSNDADENHRHLRTQQEWCVDTWANILKASPDISAIIKKIYPHTKRGKLAVPFQSRWEDDPYETREYHPEGFSTRHFNVSLKMSHALASGLYTTGQGDEFSQSVTQRLGKAVCVFVNKEGKFHTGSNLSQSIAGARMYESLEAAKRSTRTSFPNQDLTFIEVDVSFQQILEATTNPAIEMKRVQSMKEKEDMLNSLKASNSKLAPENGQPPSKKHKM